MVKKVQMVKVSLKSDFVLGCKNKISLIFTFLKSENQTYFNV